MKNIREAVRKSILVYDGSKGVLLQRMGLAGGECGDLWNADFPDRVRSIYESYRAAGSDIIQTNTFTANALSLKRHGLADRTREFNRRAARLAREVMGETGLVAGSMGPTGILLEPYGDLTEEEARQCFTEQAEALAEGGADALHLETFMDLEEMKIAIKAAKATGLTVIASMTFTTAGRTLMGSSPADCVAALKDAGADLLGANCSVGPAQMVPILEAMKEAGAGPLCAKPNAGMPRVEDGETIFDEGPEVFSRLVPAYLNAGAVILGGCCGTGPDHIRAIRRAVDSRQQGA